MTFIIHIIKTYSDPALGGNQNEVEFNNAWNKAWCEELLVKNKGFGQYKGLINCTPLPTGAPTTSETSPKVTTTSQSTSTASPTSAQPFKCPAHAPNLLRYHYKEI